jgi:hypothetical protein
MTRTSWSACAAFYRDWIDMSWTETATMMTQTKKPGCILSGSPVTNWFHSNTCGLTAADENIIAPDPHLQRPTEKAAPDHCSFGSFSEAHVGQPFTDFLAHQNLEYLE